MAEITLRVPPDKLTRPYVAIVGFTAHRKKLYELDRSQWEIWGLNELWRYDPVENFDRWFEIHDRPVIDADKEHIAAMAKFQIPIYMQRHFDDIPPSFGFPKETVEAHGGLRGTYKTSSPAWEFGLAMAMGAKKIAILGIDLAQDTEYVQQRPCMEYLIGRAEALGIEVIIPQTSDLCKAIGQYGFGGIGDEFMAKIAEREVFLHQQDNEKLAMLRKLDEEYGQKKAAIEQQRAKLDEEYARKREELISVRFRILGNIDDCGFWKRNWGSGVVMGDGPIPDRSLDPRTGIKAPAGDTKVETAQAATVTNRIAAAAVKE